VLTNIGRPPDRVFPRRKSLKKRESNRPDRRIAPAGTITPGALEALASRVQYVGEGHHKLHPGNYGFHPPVNPRGSKAPCDDLRPILLEEAAALFRAGIELGLTSRFGETENPKYVWAVDNFGEAYEAKISKIIPNSYHGYRLREEEDDIMRKLVVKEWKQRCQR
jgi:hypothetical protein